MAQNLDHVTVTVTTSGTEKQLSAESGVPRFVRSVTLAWVTTNTGNILIGKSTVSTTNWAIALHSTNQVCTISGEPLNPKPGDPNNMVDLSSIYVDAAVSGEKVQVSWLA